MSQEYVYWLSLRRQALLLSLADLLKFFFYDPSERAGDERQLIQNAGACALTKPRRRKRTLRLFLSLFVAWLLLLKGGGVSPCYWFSDSSVN